MQGSYLVVPLPGWSKVGGWQVTAWWGRWWRGEGPRAAGGTLEKQAAEVVQGQQASNTGVSPVAVRVHSYRVAQNC